MINVIEVQTKKEKKLFVDFPTELYSKVKQYVPPLRSSEFELFDPKKNPSYDDCIVAYFLAKRDNKVVGRIAVIVQKLYNEKVNEKRVRFTRFDCVNDFEVAKALFAAAEDWARKQKMEIIHGPLGFNDLDREGLLVEGFDEIATFEEAYNFEYYKTFIEMLGYEKETDWLESHLKIPEVVGERLLRIANVFEKRYKLKHGEKKNKKDFYAKYLTGIFEIIDEAYADLHGVVPLTEKVRKVIVDQFNLFITLDLVSVVLDENDNMVGFGFAIPSLSEVMTKYKGKLNLFSLIAILRAVKKPKQADLAIIGVKKEWLTKGVTAVIMKELSVGFAKVGVTHCETNLNLEDNIHIQQLWKNYDSRQHKRRRCYIKNL